MKTSFYKEFLDPDNDRFWTKTSEKVKYDLDTGKLQIINPDSDFDYHSNEFFNLNPKGYYRIEAKINHLSGVNNWGFGITWGLKDLENYNSFEISNNGSYRIYKEENDTLTKIVNWKESDILNIDKPNILRIERSRTSISFYINNNYVCNIANSKFYDDFFGQRVGFVVKKNQTIEIDYLKISSNQGKPIIPSLGDLIVFGKYYNFFQEHGFSPATPEYWDE